MNLKSTMPIIPELHVSGSHFEIGLAIGKHFAAEIQYVIDAYAFFKEEVKPYHQTQSGQEHYAELLAVHQQSFPEYIQEIRGIAVGAERPFEDVFLINLRGEYRGFIDNFDIRGCSDCSLFTNEAALIGHNEDGAPVFREHMYFVHAKINDGTRFTACSYPGFLCGNAFGCNTHGIFFSVDDVRPHNVRAGLARHFLARSLLDAISLEDAITRVTPDYRASGFSYTIGSVTERRIIRVEVTPDDYHVREIHGAHFHANHIQDIPNVQQTIAPSSTARVVRANAMLQAEPVTDAAGILRILGDQTHVDYPIYRTATPPDDLETFCTALFNLDTGELRIYTGSLMQQFISFRCDNNQ
jgi:predicted choloylglycine hydrolase